MPLIRRVLAPLVLGVLATLALLAPGSVGATGTPIYVGPATGPTGSTGSSGPPQTLTASVTACHADPLQANRYAIFASQMTAVAGTRTMAVEFALQERSAGASSFTAVSAPGFGAWVSSQPGVGIYTYDHEITALPAPAAFRVLVRARWLNRRRRVIHTEELLSPVCAQPLQTPDLAVGALRRAHPAGSAGEDYSVQVVNTGAVAAGAFEVGLTVNGVALADVSVPGLAADAATVVQFAGPACTAGSTLVAVADAAGAIAEPASPARTRSFPCAP
jgi:CARDB protein